MSVSIATEISQVLGTEKIMKEDILTRGKFFYNNFKFNFLKHH